MAKIKYPKKVDVPDVLFTSKYNKTVAEFVAAKLEEGINIKECCQQFKEHGVPTEDTIYKWRRKYPEFKERLYEARQTWFMKQLDEVDFLSKEALKLTKDLTEVDKETAAAYRLRIEALRQRIDLLKFSLAKMAPRMVPEMQDTSVAQQAPVNITIVSYADQTKEGRVIEHKKD